MHTTLCIVLNFIPPKRLSMIWWIERECIYYISSPAGLQRKSIWSIHQAQLANPRWVKKNHSNSAQRLLAFLTAFQLLFNLLQFSLNASLLMLWAAIHLKSPHDRWERCYTVFSPLREKGITGRIHQIKLPYGSLSQSYGPYWLQPTIHGHPSKAPFSHSRPQAVTHTKPTGVTGKPSFARRLPIRTPPT